MPKSPYWEKIAHSLDYPCAKQKQPNLVWMAEHLERHGEIEASMVMRLHEKRFENGHGKRIYDPTQTPLDR